VAATTIAKLDKKMVAFDAKLNAAPELKANFN
jgi:hypothetical protein